MGRGGPGKHLKVAGMHSRGLGKGCASSALPRGRKIAIECYTNCIRNGALWGEVS